jgi:hypothetical protein
MQFIDLASPFVIYEDGDGYVLPNVLPAIARDVSERLREERPEDVINSLRASGHQRLSRKTTVHDAEKVWNSFLSIYLTPQGPDTPSIASRVEMLSLMLSASPAEAWKALKQRILANVDDLSGWSSSFRKILGERDQIWRGEDGNYYQKQWDGRIYRVMGGQTLEEARLDFIADQIMRDFGTLHLFLQFFALLMIAYDFTEHRDSYPNSMRAVLQERQWPALNHRWSLLQWIAVRTVVWRPWSNLCDPRWLAGDLLGAITDTTKFEPFRSPTISSGGQHQLDPAYDRQADFALDTLLRISDEETVVFEFGGRQFRWINASLESDTRVSVGLKPGEDSSAAEEELNRCLSLLVWEHRFPAAKKSGPIVGQKRPLPWIMSPRSAFSVNVGPATLVRTKLDLIGHKEKLALAMYREAVNARSVFYEFLNYWKVVEVVFPKKDERFAWVDQTAILLTDESNRIESILQSNARIAVYLDSNCRNAVVHVFRKPFVDPDSSEDFARLSLDLPIVRTLAKTAISTLPAFESSH